MEMKEGTFKLLIENALLEQEKRLSSEFRREMVTQTDRFTKIVDGHNSTVIGITQDIAKLQVYQSNLKTRVWTIGAVCGSVSGLLVFIIDRIIFKS
jgi:hypothetical protein